MTSTLDDTITSDETRAFRNTTRPLVIGPALWMLGSLVWAFTVAGEFTTAGFIGEGVAVVGVFGATVAASILGIQRHLASVAPVHRAAGSTIAKTLGMFGLFVVTLALPLSVLQTGSDIGMTLLLLFVGISAVGLGRRWSGPAKNPPRATVRLSFVALGVVLSMATVVHVLVVN